MNRLHFNYPNAFNYGFFHTKIGFWIGATPEQFIQIANETIKTVALAGTQLFAETISWENKEKQEQYFASLIKERGFKYPETSLASECTYYTGQEIVDAGIADVMINSLDELHKVVKI